MTLAEPKPIKEYAIGIYDGPHATPADADDGPIFLGIKNITEDGRLDFSEVKHVSEQEYPRWTKRVVPQPGDLVFTYEATLHRYALIKEGFRGCLGRRVALVRPNPDLVDPRYLLYHCLAYEWRRKVEAIVINGATVNRIPLEKFPDLLIRLPSLERQKAIADVLSTYDDLIVNNERRIVLLEQAAQLLFEEWFIRLRFPSYAISKTDEGLPEGWEFKTLGDVAPLVYGKALKEENRRPGEFAVYGSSGEVGAHDNKLASSPGIIVGRKGNVGSVFWASRDFWVIDTAYYVDPSHVSLFVYHLLKAQTFENSDAAVPGLNREYAHRKSVQWPPERLRTQFEAHVETLFNQRAILIQMNQKLAKARDLLLPRLIDGRITA